VGIFTLLCPPPDFPIFVLVKENKKHDAHQWQLQIHDLHSGRPRWNRGSSTGTDTHQQLSRAYRDAGQLSTHGGPALHRRNFREQREPGSQRTHDYRPSQP
jgi:hypothetical protein